MHSSDSVHLNAYLEIPVPFASFRFSFRMTSFGSGYLFARNSLDGMYSGRTSTIFLSSLMGPNNKLKNRMPHFILKARVIEVLKRSKFNIRAVGYTAKFFLHFILCCIISRPAASQFYSMPSSTTVRFAYLPGRRFGIFTTVLIKKCGLTNDLDGVLQASSDDLARRVLRIAEQCHLGRDLLSRL